MNPLQQAQGVPGGSRLLRRGFVFADDPSLLPFANSADPIVRELSIEIDVPSSAHAAWCRARTLELPC